MLLAGQRVMLSFRARASSVVGLVLACASAQAAPATASDQAVHAIEQTMRVLSKHPCRDVFVDAVNGDRVSVTLRPARNVVVVKHGFLSAEQHGFFPGPNGELSERDRAALAQYIGRERGVGGHEVMQNVRASVKAITAVEDRITRGEPLVAAVLADAAKARPEQAFYRQGRTRMYVRGSALVIDKKFSLLGSHELALTKNVAGAYELLPDDRATLALILAPR
jgi:hypothetical protein